MQIVIEIDEEDYKIMKHNIAVNNPLCPLSQEEMVSKVANGTPLPKGHGRLVECERLQEVFRRNVVGYAGFKQLFDIAPTIIDKAESEE